MNEKYNGVTWKVISVAMAVVIMALAGSWATFVNAKLEKIEDNTMTSIRIQSLQEARISALEKYLGRSPHEGKR